VQHFDPLDRVERYGDVAVVMTGLRVVEADAVDQHQHLAEVGAANREIRLRAPLASSPHIHGPQQPQHVRDAMHRKLHDLLARDDRQRARHRAERHRRGGGGDDDVLPEGTLRVCGRGRREDGGCQPHGHTPLNHMHSSDSFSCEAP